MRIDATNVREWLDLGYAVAPHLRYVVGALGQTGPSPVVVTVPLPEQTVAQNILAKAPGAWLRLALQIGGTAAVTGGVTYLVMKERNLKKLAVSALVGAAASQLFALGWVWTHQAEAARRSTT